MAATDLRVRSLCGREQAQFSAVHPAGTAPEAQILSTEDDAAAFWNLGIPGFSVGGGLETAITTNTTLGIEYRYAQFAKEDFDSGGAFEVEPSSHTVRVGLKYKFN